MSRAIQIRRGTADEHSNFTGLLAEVTYDTTNKTLRVHDGETPGGIILATQDGAINPNLIIAAIMPDWDNVVEQQINTEYTAQSNGYLLLAYDDYNGTSCIIINGNQYTVNAIIGTAAGASSGSVCLPVAQGDVYKYIPGRSHGSVDTYIKFIPIRGF